MEEINHNAWIVQRHYDHPAELFPLFSHINVVLSRQGGIAAVKRATQTEASPRIMSILVGPSAGDYFQTLFGASQSGKPHSPSPLR